MSQNRLDFDLAIEELKADRPEAERRLRALGAIQGLQPRRYRMATFAATATAVVLAALLVVPARGNGLTWESVQEKTQRAVNVHTLFYNAAGKLSREDWRSGTLWATWSKDESGRLRSEIRGSAKDYYHYIYRDQMTAPNAYQYAEIWSKTPQIVRMEKGFTGPARTVEQLLGGKDAKLISHEHAEVSGQSFERYTLTRYKQQMTVDADPKTGLIATITYDGGGVAKLDYPASINSEVFSYRSRLIKDVPVLDTRGHDDLKALSQLMPPVIVRKQGIELRQVTISPWGQLFVSWTGPMPKRRLDIPGVSFEKIDWFGPGVGTDRKPTKLMFFRVQPKEKVGDRLTVRFPLNGSLIEFRNVKVSRLQALKE